MAPDEPLTNVQDIMAQIEQRVWDATDKEDFVWLPDVDPQLRDHLIRLREMAGSLQVEPAVHGNALPFIGRLITWWRAQIHQLVLFYINSVMRQQVGFEQAVTRTIIYLAKHLEAENRALRSEVEDLRRQVGQIDASSREE
jgi:hypothetical protein